MTLVMGLPPLKPWKTNKEENTMTAFTIGLLAGGVIGIPLACWLAMKRKEKNDGSKKQQV